MFNVIFWFPFIASIKQIMQYMKHMKQVCQLNHITDFPKITTWKTICTTSMEAILLCLTVCCVCLTSDIKS